MEQLRQVNGGAVARRDGSYEDQVNRLIDRAESLANDEVGTVADADVFLGDPAKAKRWTEAFHRQMDLLCHAAGLRTASWIAARG